MHRAHGLTLRDLCGQRGGDGDEVALLAAIVNGHLAPLARVIHVAVALGHEQFQRVVAVHEHTWEEEAAVSLVSSALEEREAHPVGSLEPAASYLDLQCERAAWEPS